MVSKHNKIGIIFIIPFFVLFLIFNFYPILYTFYLSLGRYDGFSPFQFLGFTNYATVFKDQFFLEAFFNTLIMWGINIVLQLSLSFGLVMIFTDIKFKFKGLQGFRLAYYLPNLIAATSVALIFSTILNTNYGFINQLLDKYNLIDAPIPWLEHPFLAQVSVSFIQTWMWFGNSFIILMAAALSIPKEYFEAATIDGAGRLAILKNITIPTIRPVLIYVGITSLIGGLQLFDIPFLLTDGAGAPSGSLRTVIMYSFNLAFKSGNYGYAAAVSYVLFLIILAITILFYTVSKIKRVR